MVDVYLGAVVNGGIGYMTPNVVNDVCYCLAILWRLFGLVTLLFLGDGCFPRWTTIGRVGGAWVVLKNYLTSIYGRILIRVVGMIVRIRNVSSGSGLPSGCTTLRSLIKV